MLPPEAGAEAGGGWSSGRALALTCCVCWLVAAAALAGAAEVASAGLGRPDAGPGLMLRPQRPSQFRHEGEVKAYLQRLRDWVQDSMRNNARSVPTRVAPLRLNARLHKRLVPILSGFCASIEYFS